MGYQWNEIGFKVKDAKRLLGLEVHQDGIEKAGFARVMEYSGFNKTEVTVNLMVYLEKKTWVYLVLQLKRGKETYL